MNAVFYSCFHPSHSRRHSVGICGKMYKYERGLSFLLAHALPSCFLLPSLKERSHGQELSPPGLGGRLFLYTRCKGTRWLADVHGACPRVFASCESPAAREHRAERAECSPGAGGSPSPEQLCSQSDVTWTRAARSVHSGRGRAPSSSSAHGAAWHRGLDGPPGLPAATCTRQDLLGCE